MIKILYVDTFYTTIVYLLCYYTMQSTVDDRFIKMHTSDSKKFNLNMSYPVVYVCVISNDKLFKYLLRELIC